MNIKNTRDNIDKIDYGFLIRTIKEIQSDYETSVNYQFRLLNLHRTLAFSERPY